MLQLLIRFPVGYTVKLTSIIFYINLEEKLKK